MDCRSARTDSPAADKTGGKIIFMKQLLKSFLFLPAMVLSALTVLAQNSDIEMADTLRSNGKIYVVVAVLLIILTGLIVFLIRIDKKISKLEKKNQNNP